MRLPISTTVPQTLSRHKNAPASGKITSTPAGIISADTVIFDSFCPDLRVRSACEVSVTAQAKCCNFVV